MIQPFKYYFLPFLLSLKDKKTHKIIEISEFVGVFFNMSSVELSSPTKGGGVTKHNSRINYCASYLKRMGFVETKTRGLYSITTKGLHLLKTYGDTLTLDSIKVIPEYLELQKGRSKLGSDRVLIEGHYKNGKYIPPYYCNVSQVGEKMREQCIKNNKIIMEKQYEN